MGGSLVAACILAVLIAGGIAHADDTSTTSETTFMLDQSVSGTGFYNTYQNISLGQTSLSSLNHGSGSYVYDAKTDSSVNTYALITASRSQQIIQMKESVDAVYSVVKFNFTGSTGTISFNSPIEELTCAKNYGQGASMNAKFFYADKLKKDADASLYWNSNLSDVEWENYYEKTQSRTSLNLESEFSGKAHIGALTGTFGQKRLITTPLTDEDYSGAFTITKKMTLASYTNRTALSFDWLPCCTGGWSTMDIHDQVGHGTSAKGIFDCTCYTVSDTAEFQRQGK